MKNLKQRWQAPTPKLAKRVIAVMVAIGGVCVAILGYPTELSNIVTNIAGVGVAIGTLGAALAKLMVEKQA